jgi:Mn-containing catalase
LLTVRVDDLLSTQEYRGVRDMFSFLLARDTMHPKTVIEDYL